MHDQQSTDLLLPGNAMLHVSLISKVMIYAPDNATRGV